MKRPDRLQLVGLLSEDPHIVIPEGSQLVENTRDLRKRVRPAVIGHVTSSYFSPILNRSFALALLVQGRDRHNEIISAIADNVSISVKVTTPTFLDPEGVRLRD
jgi:sarcosine oxidase subunit alpha